jgi:hypothetical protein
VGRKTGQKMSQNGDYVEIAVACAHLVVFSHAADVDFRCDFMS